LSLSLGLWPPGQSSHNVIKPIPNLNDISYQDRHLFESTNSYHAPTHDDNPSVVASSFAIVTNYGKKQAYDRFQMKDSSNPEKQM
jgi:hypothetical protein